MKDDQGRRKEDLQRGVPGRHDPRYLSCAELSHNALVSEEDAIYKSGAMVLPANVFDGL
jgi:hypothetical protein